MIYLNESAFGALLNSPHPSVQPLSPGRDFMVVAWIKSGERGQWRTTDSSLHFLPGQEAPRRDLRISVSLRGGKLCSFMITNH